MPTWRCRTNVSLRAPVPAGCLSSAHRAPPPARVSFLLACPHAPDAVHARGRRRLAAQGVASATWAHGASTPPRAHARGGRVRVDSGHPAGVSTLPLLHSARHYALSRSTPGLRLSGGRATRSAPWSCPPPP